MQRNFAIIGVGGYIAPRHLKAIKDTGNRLVAAIDPKDSVGLLDSYAFNVAFFTEIERFDRHLEKLRRGPEEKRVHYIERVFAQLPARRALSSGDACRRGCDL